MQNPIHEFPSGMQINLMEVYAIGHPYTDSMYNKHFNIYIKGDTKPMKIFMYSVFNEKPRDEAEIEERKSAQQCREDVIRNWERFINDYLMKKLTEKY